MNRRLVVILLSAFIVAAGCSFLVYRIVGGRLSTARQASIRVVVAANDIKLGSVLRAQDLTSTEVTGALPKGIILNSQQAIGRGVISDLYQGEAILENRLATVGSGGGLAATISQGMRACAVKVDDVVGVAGFVTPGMHVDVLISGNPSGPGAGSDGTRVRTILQNIAVLSAGTDIQKDAEGKPKQVQVVNLLVTPEQAELLSLASSQTRIQLVLRNPLDTDMSHPPGTAMAGLFGDAKPLPVAVAHNATPAAPRPANHVYVIEVFNGSKRSEEKIVSGEGK